ncbi:MAG: mechanosensitive ion channel family protein [Caldilineaceae bacterium]
MQELLHPRRLEPDQQGGANTLITMNFDFSPAFAKVQAMLNGLIAAIPNIIVALVVLVLFFFIARGIGSLVERISSRYNKHKNVGLVFNRLTQWLILLIGVLLTAVILFPNFTLASMIEFLGIGSVAIGFAFRDILQNFLAGILLLLTEPFRIGDQIIVNDFEGTVEEIQTRATFIKTYDGRRVVIPNAELFVDSVTVNTAFEQRRLQYDVGIGYGDDIGAASTLIFAALEECDMVLADPAPEVLLVDLAASSVNLRVRWWIKPPRRRDVLDSQNEVLVAIKQKLSANGIDMPFPTQQILFHDQTEETDGDRTRQREGWPAGGEQAAPQPRKIATAMGQLADTFQSTAKSKEQAA